MIGRGRLSDRIGWSALIAFAVLGVVSVVVPILVSTDPNVPVLSRRLQPPTISDGWTMVLGSDELGRSVLLRVIFGLRTSYVISVAAVVIAAALGTVAGLYAGYLGGWVDSVIMRVVDIQIAFPALLLAMVFVAFIDGGQLVLVVVLAFSSWTLFARVVRAAVLNLRGGDFIDATVALGASSKRVMWRHLLPNALPNIVAIATFELAGLMLAEATLSFLGFGIQEPAISLGAILSAGRDYIPDQWWSTTFSGASLALAVASTNISGTWMERRLNPLRTAMRAELAA